MRLPQILFAALLLALCASCSNIHLFQHAVVPYGGHDGPAGEDQVYFELRNVEGLTGGGLSALMLPADWAERRTVLDERGVLVLEPPVEQQWTFGSDIEPKATLVGGGEMQMAGDLSLRGTSSATLNVPVFDDPSHLDADTAWAATQLAAGDSAYALVDVSKHPGEGPVDYQLFGARLAEADPSMGLDRTDVEWVQLLTLRFDDSRGMLARGLDVPLRQVPFLEVSLYVAALIWPVFVF